MSIEWENKYELSPDYVSPADAEKYIQKLATDGFEITGVTRPFLDDEAELVVEYGCFPHPSVAIHHLTGQVVLLPSCVILQAEKSFPPTDILEHVALSCPIFGVEPVGIVKGDRDPAGEIGI